MPSIPTLVFFAVCLLTLGWALYKVLRPHPLPVETPEPEPLAPNYVNPDAPKIVPVIDSIGASTDSVIRAAVHSRAIAERRYPPILDLTFPGHLPQLPMGVRTRTRERSHSTWHIQHTWTAPAINQADTAKEPEPPLKTAWQRLQEDD